MKRQKENEKEGIELNDVEKVDEKAIIETCPLCGSKMEKGYIISRMISWSAKKIGFWSFKSGEKIVSGGYPYFPQNVEAYRCKKCKLIIFKYGEKK